MVTAKTRNFKVFVLKNRFFKCKTIYKRARKEKEDHALFLIQDIVFFLILQNIY